MRLLATTHALDVAPPSFPIPARSIGHLAIGMLALLAALGLGMGWLSLRRSAPDRARRLARAAAVCLGVYALVVAVNALVDYPQRRRGAPPTDATPAGGKVCPSGAPFCVTLPRGWRALEPTQGEVTPIGGTWDLSSGPADRFCTLRSTDTYAYDDNVKILSATVADAGGKRESASGGKGVYLEWVGTNAGSDWRHFRMLVDAYPWTWDCDCQQPKSWSGSEPEGICKSLESNPTPLPPPVFPIAAGRSRLLACCDGLQKQWAAKGEPFESASRLCLSLASSEKRLEDALDEIAKTLPKDQIPAQCRFP